MERYKREKFEELFAYLNRVPLDAVIACRAGENYWDEANLKTAGISRAWTFWKAAIDTGE